MTNHLRSIKQNNKIQYIQFSMECKYFVKCSVFTIYLKKNGHNFTYYTFPKVYIYKQLYCQARHETMTIRKTLSWISL